MVFNGIIRILGSQVGSLVKEKVLTEIMNIGGLREGGIKTSSKGVAL